MNLETIHTHDVVAERYGTVGELRARARGGEAAGRHTELREWLANGVAGPRANRKRVSVPARSRLMFGRCRTSTASAASAAKAITGQGSSQQDGRDRQRERRHDRRDRRVAEERERQRARRRAPMPPTTGATAEERAAAGRHRLPAAWRSP